MWLFRWSGVNLPRPADRRSARVDVPAPAPDHPIRSLGNPRIT